MLYYEIYNNDSPNWVVFVHGFGGSTLTWKKQIAAFSDYNLLLLDLPGHGNSTEENQVTIYGVSVRIKEVLDHLKIKKADFVGMSLGTLVLAHFALKFPEYVNSVIFGGASLKLGGIYKPLLGIVNLTKELMPTKFLFTTMSKIILPRKNHQLSRKIFIRESLKMKRRNVLLWVTYVWKVLNTKDMLKRLQQLDIEMLFVSGEEDICFVDGAKHMANSLPNANFAVIEHCGHVCTIEKYQEFNRLALDFLERIHQKQATMFA